MNRDFDNKLFEAFANASDSIYIYVTDLRQNLTRWSKCAVEFFGFNDEYQYDMKNSWLEYIHPDDREFFLEDIEAVIRGEKVQHDCQYRARNKYGEFVWVECKGSIVFDENNNPDLFAGIMTRLDNPNKYDTVTHLLTGYELVRKTFSETGSLMFIGIDNFRAINSRYGIVYGNDILRFLADVITSNADGAEVYRFQRDEFAVYGSNMTADDMIAIFKRVYNKCSVTKDRGKRTEFYISAGIVEFSDEESSAIPVSNAELTLGFAKKDSLYHYSVYSEDIKKKQKRKNLVSEELLKSIENDFKGFNLVYQPILANAGDKVVACEALVRWKSDNEAIGACYPDEFISILESNGGINKLGYFVMREAIKQAGIWQKKYKRFNVSFNVSYLQLEDDQFVLSILENIDRYGVDPTGIIVELTESVLDVDTVMLMSSFQLLKSRGIKIALDDFGTGNSSFWMLHNIDVDIVKLDQGFIRALNPSGEGIDCAIVESVRLMCKRIGCKTVAEGVETELIWNLLSKHEFNGLQGYFFSKPIEVNDFEKLLNKYDMNIV